MGVHHQSLMIEVRLLSPRFNHKDDVKVGGGLEGGGVFL